MIFFSNLCLGKHTLCFGMTKVRLFKDLKEAHNEYKNNTFYESGWSKFSFVFHGLLFS